MGFVWGLFGVLIIIDPTFYSSYLHQYVDFRGIEWTFGGGLIILGIFFIRSYFKNKPDYTEVLMCPKCIKPFDTVTIGTRVCPKCETKLEKLKGFYERHPELKENQT